MTQRFIDQWVAFLCRLAACASCGYFIQLWQDTNSWMAVAVAVYFFSVVMTTSTKE